MANKKIRTKEKPVDFILVVTVLIMLALGVVMVLSASSPSALAENGKSYTYVKTQGISAILGLILMAIISKVDYKKYKNLYKIAYFASVVILLAVLIPGVGKESNGAVRWIKIGSTMTFQPSEAAKIGLVVFYAAYLTKNREKLGKFSDGFIKPLLFLVPVLGILIFVQSHLSASILIILIVAIMMLMAGSKLRYFVTFGSIGVCGGCTALYVLAKYFHIGEYRLERLTAFLNPWADPTDSGWQIVQSLYAIGSGGLFGVGLGNSTQKYLYLPEPANDFIFAVIAEELGFIGCLVVIILFAIFVWRGTLIAMKAPDMFGSLLAVGITAIIGLQAMINIAVVTSSMPNTGMQLPFFSYGGTSLLILLCSVRSIAKYLKADTENIGRTK